MITYTNLKDKPQEFLAATSLMDNEFQRLLPIFRVWFTQLSDQQSSSATSTQVTGFRHPK
jgi:hypothetical protein